MRIVPLILLALLYGCSTAPRNVIYEGDDFVVVAGKANDSYAKVAQDVLNDPGFAAQVARANPGLQLNGGSAVLVPKLSANPMGIYADGVQHVPILCYHQFDLRAQRSRGMVVSAEHFEAQLAYLRDNDFSVVSLDDVAAFVRGEKALPAKSVAITIDDGYKSVFDVAYPILKKYGYPATVFVYPEFVGGGKALDWGQIRILDKDPLISIESHSKTHDNLSPRPGGEDKSRYLARIKHEVDDTDRIFTRKLGRNARQFAYPYGNTSNELVELLDQRDYDLALTVKKGGNPSFSHPMLLRRTMVYGEDSVKRFASYLNTFDKVDLR